MIDPNLAPVITAIGGAVSAILGVFTAIYERAKNNKQNEAENGNRPIPKPRPWLVFLSTAGFGIGITALLVAFLHAQGPQEPQRQGIQPSFGQKGTIPKGTVIMWWGAKDTWPKPDFELCDGKYSAALGRDKPLFYGRIARGALENAVNQGDLQRGGQESTPLPAHTHHVPPHKHPVTRLIAAWGRQETGDRRLFRRVPGNGTFKGGIAIGQNPDGGIDQETSTGTAIVGLNGEPAQTDDSQWLNTEDTSAATINLLPPYQDVFYIIKVLD